MLACLAIIPSVGGAISCGLPQPRSGFSEAAGIGDTAGFSGLGVPAPPPRLPPRRLRPTTAMAASERRSPAHARLGRGGGQR